MDVDEDEEGTQQVKRVPDFGIEVDFESLDDDEREVSCCAPQSIHDVQCSVIQDNTGETLKELDESIAKVNAEIEHMAPNLKAMDRY